MADTDIEQVRVGPAGRTLAANIKRIREAQRLTFVEVAKRLEDIGRPIAVLGLRRIEKGERRVDADDLLALAAVLGVHTVDLLVPPEAVATSIRAASPDDVLPAVQVVRVQPDDLLVFQCDARVPDETADWLLNQAKVHFPDNKTIILDSGMRLSVVRKDGA